eukprot:SAG31_NODE_42227_length_272_cov_1.023121_1_plen_22_part_10
MNQFTIENVFSDFFLRVPSDRL